jgi:hypothetical protein
MHDKIIQDGYFYSLTAPTIPTVPYPTPQAPPVPVVNQPNASFGDIMLVPDPQDSTKSRVLIFYGNAPGWGQICADQVRPREKNIADVICKQNGRKGGTFYQLSR